MTYRILWAALLLPLSACAETADKAQETQGKVDQAIDGQGLIEAVGASVDKDALKGVVQGAAAAAMQEALPMEEAAVLGAVVDEEALISGIDKAVDGRAVQNALGDAMKTTAPEAVPAE